MPAQARYERRETMEHPTLCLAEQITLASGGSGRGVRGKGSVLRRRLTAGGRYAAVA